MEDRDGRDRRRLDTDCRLRIPVRLPTLGSQNLHPPVAGVRRSVKHNLLSELKRRNVIRAAVLYGGTVWALTQGIAQLAPVVGAPDWAARWFLVACAIGFPFWIAFAWFYEFTPQGLKRESEIDPADSAAHRTSRKLDLAIIGVLAIVVVLLLTDRFVLRQGVNAQTTTPVPAQSIAVLPFSNLSSDKDQEYFSDGISEELLNLLAKIPELQVTARTSSFAFKGKEIGIPEIARQLHVAHILEGSVQKAGDDVRITVQLVDAGSDTQRWSRSWDRKLDDIFKIQDEIAGEVVKELRVKLLGAAPTARPTDARAYALYLQARALGQQKTDEAFAKSDELYRRALTIDPRYVPALVGLANNVISEMGLGIVAGKSGYADARQAAEQAIEIDPDHAAAHAALGRVALYEGDLAAAAREYQRALAIEPRDPGTLGQAALLLQSLGRLDQALTIDEAVVRRDPVNVRALYNLGMDQLWAGQLDAAIATFRTVLDLSPDRSGTHATIGQVLLLNGDAHAGLAEIEKETSDLWRTVGLAMVFDALGRKPESDKEVSRLISEYEKEAPYNIAYVYAFHGEADQAFEWLDKAADYGDPGLSEIVVESLFDNIRTDSRWLTFLRKIGKAPEQLAKVEFQVTLPAAGGSD